MSRMILVTGAGGKTGKAVIKALVACGAPVRAFVRSSAHEGPLRTIGVREIVAGAMDDTDALSRAGRGADAIYHICPNVIPHEIAFARALLSAARNSALPGLCLSSRAARDVPGTLPRSQIEIPEAFGRALNKTIRAEAEAIESWKQRARDAGMNDYSR